VRTVDLAHPARSERGDDLVRAEAGAGFESHRVVSGARLPRPFGAAAGSYAPRIASTGWRREARSAG
jgi:hypothetical protein